MASMIHRVRQEGSDSQFLGIRPWWRRAPWTWRDPMGTPGWKRGLNLPRLDPIDSEYEYPLWALYFKLASLPVNAVYYPAKTVADIPVALWKRFVTMKRGKFVRVYDWDLVKDFGYYGTVYGVLLGKNVLRGKYEVLLPTGRTKMYNCNDLECRAYDQEPQMTPDQQISHMENVSVLYTYENDTQYYDPDATRSDDEDLEYRQAMMPLPTVNFGFRSHLLPGDAVRIQSGYRKGEYAILMKQLHKQEKWGVMMLAGKEFVSYNEDQLMKFNPTTPLEDLISPSDPNLEETLSHIEAWKRNETEYTDFFESELLEPALDPNAARDLTHTATSDWEKYESWWHNPVMQHLMLLQFYFHPKRFREALARVQANPVLTDAMDKMADHAINAAGPRVAGEHVLSTKSQPALQEEDVRDEWISEMAHEYLPALGIYGWDEAPVKPKKTMAQIAWEDFKHKIGINRTFEYFGPYSANETQIMPNLIKTANNYLEELGPEGIAEINSQLKNETYMESLKDYERELLLMRHEALANATYVKNFMLSTNTTAFARLSPSEQESILASIREWRGKWRAGQERPVLSLEGIKYEKNDVLLHKLRSMVEDKKIVKNILPSALMNVHKLLHEAISSEQIEILVNTPPDPAEPLIDVNTRLALTYLLRLASQASRLPETTVKKLMAMLSNNSIAASLTATAKSVLNELIVVQTHPLLERLQNLAMNESNIDPAQERFVKEWTHLTRPENVEAIRKSLGNQSEVDAMESETYKKMRQVLEVTSPVYSLDPSAAHQLSALIREEKALITPNENLRNVLDDVLKLRGGTAGAGTATIPSPFTPASVSHQNSRTALLEKPPSLTSEELEKNTGNYEEVGDSLGHQQKLYASVVGSFLKHPVVRHNLDLETQKKIGKMVDNSRVLASFVISPDEASRAKAAIQDREFFKSLNSEEKDRLLQVAKLTSPDHLSKLEHLSKNEHMLSELDPQLLEGVKLAMRATSRVRRVLRIQKLSEEIKKYSGSEETRTNKLNELRRLTEIEDRIKQENIELQEIEAKLTLPSKADDDIEFQTSNVAKLLREKKFF